jgi:hypothetical protein
MMTLWSIFRSPLMMGGELRDNDPWTLSLLANPEVLDVNRDSTGNRPVSREGGRIVWTARNQSGAVYVALFNVGDEPSTVSAAWTDLGLTGPRTVRDLWKREDAGRAEGSVERRVPPHGAALLKLS